jgi:hypothetical protein
LSLEGSGLRSADAHVLSRKEFLQNHRHLNLINACGIQAIEAIKTQLISILKEIYLKNLDTEIRAVCSKLLKQGAGYSTRIGCERRTTGAANMTQISLRVEQSLLLR